MVRSVTGDSKTQQLVLDGAPPPVTQTQLHAESETVRGLVPGVRLQLERAKRGIGGLIDQLLTRDQPALVGAAAGHVELSGAPLAGPTSWQVPAQVLQDPVSSFRSKTGLASAKLADVIRAHQDPASAHHAEATACLQDIVDGLKSYCESRGIERFAHWFSTWTGDVSYKRSLIDDLSIKTLFQGEVDGSSKPSGGLRGTHHARGYTIWDSTAKPFVLDGTTLCIPALFLTHNGEAMDLKIPAKRAAESLSTSMQSFLELVQPGRYDFTKLEPGFLAGPEQEYFLLPKDVAEQRPDLVACGRTLIGNAPAHNQQLAEHYFGRLPSDVGPFFEEFNRELTALGITPSSDHGEVAPRQYEVAPNAGDAVSAADQNLIVMNVLRRVAERHGLTALTHEKPFAGINGSGKHLNFSLGLVDRETGRPAVNLTEPPKDEQDHLSYLLFLSAFLVAVKRHAPLLRASVATRSNDQRLGGHEAPPAIISVMLGDTLNRMIAKNLGGDFEAKDTRTAIDLGLDGIPTAKRGGTDRNRTSPMPFTENRFEFRMPGADSSQFLPLAVIFASTGDVLDEITAKLKQDLTKSGDREETIRATVRDLMKEAAPVIFEGDAYSEAWRQEAKQRGLPEAKDSATAYLAFSSPESKELLARRGVMRPEELSAFADFKMENYAQRVAIEADVMLEMVSTGIRPAAVEQQAKLAARVASLENAKSDGLNRAKADLAEIDSLIAALDSATKAVASSRSGLDEIEDTTKRAQSASRETAPAMDELRASVDALEKHLPRDAYPYPTTTELLTARS